MPLVPFESPPSSARVWVFAGDRAVAGPAAERLLREVDAYLAQWTARGAPLTVGRDWRDDRFLTIAVDEADVGASGCSIDGLFRSLSALGPAIGASMIGTALVHYRDRSGAIRSVSREEFGEGAAHGEITTGTPVYDPSVTILEELRERFESTVGESWHAPLLQVSVEAASGEPGCLPSPKGAVTRIHNEAGRLRNGTNVRSKTMLGAGRRVEAFG